MAKWHMLSPEQRADEAEKILNPRRYWPLFPLLPVKRTAHGEFECGTMLAGDRPFRVYKKLVFTLRDGPAAPQLAESGVYGEYATIEALQADGWRGD